MSQVNFSDFYQVPDLKFNISKLRLSLNDILEKKGFSTPKSF